MIWDGLTAKGVTLPITQAQAEHLPNRPYDIDDPTGFNLPFAITNRDAWHRFYQNQMQINGGKNDQFVAWADSGALVMGESLTKTQAAVRHQDVTGLPVSSRKPLDLERCRKD